MVLWPLIATSYAGDILQIEKRPLNLNILIMLYVGVILPQTRCILKAYNYLSLLIYKNKFFLANSENKKMHNSSQAGWEVWSSNENSIELVRNQRFLFKYFAMIFVETDGRYMNGWRRRSLIGMLNAGFLALDEFKHYWRNECVSFGNCGELSSDIYLKSSFPKQKWWVAEGIINK